MLISTNCGQWSRYTVSLRVAHGVPAGELFENQAKTESMQERTWSLENKVFEIYMFTDLHAVEVN